MVVAIAIGVQGYAMISGDEDWNIYKRIKRELEEVKNESIGCCIPLCAESARTICEQSDGAYWVEEGCSSIDDCKKGCCPPHDGQFTKYECEQASGEWMEECPGYAVELSGSSHTDFEEGGSGDIRYDFSLHTCSDTVYSNWEGTWDAFWVWTTSDGDEVHDEMRDQPLSVSISSDGLGSYVLFEGDIGQRTVWFKITDMNMEVTVDHVKLNQVKTSDEIVKGTGLCVVEE